MNETDNNYVHHCCYYSYYTLIYPCLRQLISRGRFLFKTMLCTLNDHKGVSFCLALVFRLIFKLQICLQAIMIKDYLTLPLFSIYIFHIFPRQQMKKRRVTCEKSKFEFDLPMICKNVNFASSKLKESLQKMSRSLSTFQLYSPHIYFLFIICAIDAKYSLCA